MQGARGYVLYRALVIQCHTFHTLYRRLPSVTRPNMDYALLLLRDAFVISIVTFAVTVSLAKVFAKRYSYSVDSNQVGTSLISECYMYN